MQTCLLKNKWFHLWKGDTAKKKKCTTPLLHELIRISRMCHAKSWSRPRSLVLPLSCNSEVTEAQNKNQYQKHNKLFGTGREDFAKLFSPAAHPTNECSFKMEINRLTTLQDCQETLLQQKKNVPKKQMFLLFFAQFWNGYVSLQYFMKLLIIQWVFIWCYSLIIKIISTPYSCTLTIKWHCDCVAFVLF